MAKPNIPYHGPVVTRAEAKARGLKRFFTGVPCIHGHLDERQTSNAGCRVCVNATSTACHKRDPERLTKGRAYRTKNKARLTRGKMAWAKANPESRAETGRRYYVANARKISAQYHADPAPMTQRVAAWNLLNPDARRAIGRNYRARKATAPGSHTAEDIAEILQLQGGKCAYCRKRVGKGYHVDHIVALSMGGSNDRRNLQICCRSCNVTKRAADPIAFAQMVGLLI
jgi:5-methylcytosine-specific restriction endonuclease McrA